MAGGHGLNSHAQTLMMGSTDCALLGADVTWIDLIGARKRKTQTFDGLDKAI